MIINSEEEHQALIILAQRVNPNNKNWYSDLDENGWELAGFLWRCLICNKQINKSSNMINHGLEHLKEKGLIVFI